MTYGRSFVILHNYWCKSDKRRAARMGGFDAMKEIALFYLKV